MPGRANAQLHCVILSILLVASSLWTRVAVAQTDGAQRWAFSTLSTSAGGNILSSPATGPDGTIYIGVEVGDAGSAANSGRLFAVRPDGTLKWSFDVADWIDSSPTVSSDGTVYFGCWDGMVYALNDEGRKVWSYQTGAFITASPALGLDGTVYVPAGDGNLYALNANGTLKWIFPTGDWIDSSPAIAVDGSIVFGSWDDHVYAVHPNGAEKWRVATGADVASSPAIAANGTVYVGSRDGRLYAISADGTVQWTFDAGDVVDSSPVLGADGTVYFGSLGGRLHALRPDGAELWRYPAAEQPAVKSIYATPAVRSDGSVVFATSGGSATGNALYALRRDGTLLWTAPLGDWADSSPLVTASDALYVGCTDKRLYSFHSASPARVTDWSQFRRDPFHNGQQVLGNLLGTRGRLINLSARAVAGTGDSTLITGFIVSGTGQRTVLVRGVGPGLQRFGVSGYLGDPTLAQFDDSRVRIRDNDNWESAPNAKDILTTSARFAGFSLEAGAKDAATLADYGAGGVTVHVGSHSGQVGVALMEVYDTGGQESSRVMNLSARSTVGTGPDVLIAGFIIAGEPRTVLIRAVGPTLARAPYNVGGVLTDPQLHLYRAQQVIAENDDWLSTSDPARVRSAMSSTPAFALEEAGRDAVLVVTLPPGGYTAQVSGVKRTTGVAIVEVYEVP